MNSERFALAAEAKWSMYEHKLKTAKMATYHVMLAIGTVYVQQMNPMVMIQLDKNRSTMHRLNAEITAIQKLI